MSRKHKKIDELLKKAAHLLQEQVSLCPSLVELEAWHDAGASERNVITLHVAQCTLCRAKIVNTDKK